MLLKCFFDNYTTIGPSDQDSDLQIFLTLIISLNIYCDSQEEKLEEIGRYYFFYYSVKLQKRKKK